MKRREELDYANQAFGFTIEDSPYEYKGKTYQRKLITIYDEDDEVYHPRIVFDSAWLEDFISMATVLKKRG